MAVAQPSQQGGRLGWLRASFGVKINFLLGLGLAVLLAVGVSAYRSIDALMEAGREETLTQARIAQLEGTFASLRGVIAVHRTYLLTRRDIDRRDYVARHEALNVDLGRLLASMRNTEQAALTRQFTASVSERLAGLDAALVMRKRIGLQAALAALESPAIVHLDVKIHESAEAMRSRALRALRVRQADTELTAENTAFLISWGGAFAAALLMWAMLAILRNQTLRRSAELALRQSEAQMRLITDSVPALIGFVNKEGVLQFYNRGLQSWSGRPLGNLLGSLKGASLGTLFGEEARRALEPHVAQVLRGEAQSFVFSVDSVSGERKDLSAQLVPKAEPDGVVSGYYALFTDVTALQQVERMKSDFVTNVSHELRTPLTSIRGSLGLVAAGVTGALPDKARELVGIAMQNCERLVRLVNDILDSERMRAGKMPFKIEAVDLAALIERSIGETQGFAAALGVTLLFERPAKPCRVSADIDRLVQVMSNLLSNACKFSPPSERVEVAVSDNGGMIRVTVSDRGPGVPAHEQEKLFERFMQVGEGSARQLGGTGLGLNICRTIIERLAGRVGYLPRPGGGSVFYFDLPLLDTQEAL